MSAKQKSDDSQENGKYLGAMSLEDLYSKSLEHEVKRLEKLKAAVERSEARITGYRRMEVERLERKLQNEDNDDR